MKPPKKKAVKSPTVLAYAFADHHAGGGYPSLGIDDSRFSMTQIVAAAIEGEAEWLISLGDAVDSTKAHADAPVPLRNALAAVVAAGKKVGYIDGNHDKRRVSWLHGPDFTHLDGERIVIGNKTWLGVDYRPRESLLAFLSEVDDVDGLFMHQGWHEMMGWEGSYQVSTADLPGCVTLVATGDFHGAFISRRMFGKSGQPLRLVNPGSTSLQEVSEPADKWFLAITDDDDEPFIAEPLLTRPVLKYSGICGESEADAFLDKVKADVAEAVDALFARGEKGVRPFNCSPISKPIVRVSYASTVADFHRRASKRLAGIAHLFLDEWIPDSFFSHSSAAAPSSLGGKSAAVTPLTLLDSELDPKKEPKANALARLLYDAEDPKAALADYLASELELE